ncbi:hypothetical protein V8F06_004874 [Rhypophila decipiens]
MATSFSLHRRRSAEIYISSTFYVTGTGSALVAVVRCGVKLMLVVAPGRFFVRQPEKPALGTWSDVAIVVRSLVLIFRAGALAIERVIVFYEFTGAEDQAWVYFWGLFELAISFICVCIPALLPLWNRVVLRKWTGGGITVGRKRRHPEHHDGPANAAGAPEDRHMHKRRSGEIYGPRIDSLLAPTVATHTEHAGNDTTVPRTGIVGTRRGTVDEKPVTTTTTNTTSSGTGSGGIINSMTSGSGYSSLNPPKEGTNF